MKKILSAALALMLVLSLSLSAFAVSGDDYIKLHDVIYTVEDFYESNPYTELFVYTNSELGVTELWFVKVDAPDAVFYIESDAIKFNSSNSSAICSVDKFIYSTSQDMWVISSVTSVYRDTTLMELDYLSESLNDIYDKSGDNLIVEGVNFPVPPLVVQVQGVTDQAMLEEAQKMTKTMGLLTVSGVGLMALLIGLALFGKRSLLSLR